MTDAKKKPHSTKGPAEKAVHEGAAYGAKAARIADNVIFPFIAHNPNQMEHLMTKTKTQFENFASEAKNMGRDGFEAFSKSITLYAKGIEDIMRESMAIAQKTTEKQTQLVKEALSAKTINEWAETQSRIAQTNFDDCMAAASKLSELSVRVMTESAEPLNHQLSKGMKKASGAMAA